jgi:hypothetical protein
MSFQGNRLTDALTGGEVTPPGGPYGVMLKACETAEFRPSALKVSV